MDTNAKLHYTLYKLHRQGINANMEQLEHN